MKGKQLEVGKYYELWLMSKYYSEVGQCIVEYSFKILGYVMEKNTDDILLIKIIHDYDIVSPYWNTKVIHVLSYEIENWREIPTHELTLELLDYAGD